MPYARSSSPSASNGILPDAPWSMDPRLWMSTLAWDAANRAWYYRVSKGGTVSKVGLYVVNASGNICVGFYANNGSSGTAAAPAARLATSGSVACPAAGYREVNLTATITVADGDWIAMTCDNTTASFACSPITASIVIDTYTPGLAGFEAAFPLPATASYTHFGGRTFGLRGA